MKSDAWTPLSRAPAKTPSVGWTPPTRSVSGVLVMTGDMDPLQL